MSELTDALLARPEGLEGIRIEWQDHRPPEKRERRYRGFWQWVFGIADEVPSYRELESQRIVRFMQALAIQSAKRGMPVISYLVDFDEWYALKSVHTFGGRKFQHTVPLEVCDPLNGVDARVERLWYEVQEL